MSVMRSVGGASKLVVSPDMMVGVVVDGRESKLILEWTMRAGVLVWVWGAGMRIIQPVVECSKVMSGQESGDESKVVRS